MRHPAPVIDVERAAPLPTWFGVGGGADRLARPADRDGVRALLADDPAARILGDGANLLVDDDGVDGLVIDLRAPGLSGVHIDEATGRVHAGGGAKLPQLCTAAARLGLAGLEHLAGVPASVGGAVVMNAGGPAGTVAGPLVAVQGVSREGRDVTLLRHEIPFAYRESGLEGLVVTGVDFQLQPDDPARVRERLRAFMDAKKASQPLAERSAGCCFKNPVRPANAPEIVVNGRAVPAGERVSAGLLIDRAGCKGLRIGSAEVSRVHANFITADRADAGGRARDVIAVMSEVTRRVRDAFGITLRREVVVWSRHAELADETASGGGRGGAGHAH